MLKKIKVAFSDASMVKKVEVSFSDGSMVKKVEVCDGSIICHLPLIQSFAICRAQRFETLLVMCVSIP